MKKRIVGPRGGRGKTERKRDAARDLSARAARKVVGGLLPAAPPAREVGALAQEPATRQIDQVFQYQKLQW